MLNFLNTKLFWRIWLGGFAAPLIAAHLTVAFAFEAQPAQLPKSIRQHLNRKYHAWKFPLIEQEIHQWMKQRRARPEFTSGDFDGDGLRDYAVFIVYGKPEARKTSVIAFLRRETGWKTHRLETRLAGDESLPTICFLGLAKKGTRDYDYQRDRKFTYRHDAIFSGIFEKAGVSYVYWKGRFWQITTSD